MGHRDEGEIIKTTTEEPERERKSERQVYKSQREQLNAIIQVPDHFVLGKPFLSEADLADKTMSMKRFHTWYLKACDLGLTHVLARLPSECFHLAGDQSIFIGFQLMWEFFHLEKLDNEIIRLWCL